MQKVRSPNPESTLMPAESADTLGLIAGGGQFPLLVAESAKAQGIRVVAVAHHGETEPTLEAKVEKVVWVRLGQLGQVIKAFKRNDVTKAIMAGTITKKKMFENIRPDLRGLSLMSKIAIFHDDDILRAVAEELRKEGIQIVSSIQFLPDLAASGGVLTRRRPTKEEMEDIRFGWTMAKELGRLDIGQCVVVRKKTVVAVEAMEGTDETILRGGALAKEKAVVIKVSKPHQDLRFDVPSVGPKTIQVMAKVNASVLAVEEGKTLLFDKAQMISCADRSGICVLSWEG